MVDLLRTHRASVTLVLQDSKFFYNRLPTKFIVGTQKQTEHGSDGGKRAPHQNDKIMQASTRAVSAHKDRAVAAVQAKLENTFDFNATPQKQEGVAALLVRTHHVSKTSAKFLPRMVSSDPSVVAIPTGMPRKGKLQQQSSAPESEEEFKCRIQQHEHRSNFKKETASTAQATPDATAQTALPQRNKRTKASARGRPLKKKKKKKMRETKKEFFERMSRCKMLKRKRLEEAAQRRRHEGFGLGGMEGGSAEGTYDLELSQAKMRQEQRTPTLDIFSRPGDSKQVSEVSIRRGGKKRSRKKPKRFLSGLVGGLDLGVLITEDELGETAARKISSITSSFGYEKDVVDGVLGLFALSQVYHYECQEQF
eukprot:jgi/Bigna1/91681/estExt_fgenesh1_pg.C_1120042